MALRQYGLPYQGSKNQIAEEICMFLPEGERFVDLFGGGGAITHCAMQSYKWKSFLYNELNPLVFDTFKKALNGEFEKEIKNPKWISRDEFNERKNKDGFIALMWSFSNSMQNYLFGRNIEESRRSFFEWVVNNRKDEFVNRLFPYETLEGDTWLERYREFMAIARDIDDLPMATLGQVEIEKFKCMQCLQNMKRVLALNRINRISNLSNADGLNIEFTNGSYEQFVHRGGMWCTAIFLMKAPTAKHIMTLPIRRSTTGAIRGTTKCSSHHMTRYRTTDSIGYGREKRWH